MVYIRRAACVYSSFVRLEGSFEGRRSYIVHHYRLACVCLFFVSLAFAGDFERGVEALKKKDYDQAIARLDAFIRANPQSAAAYLSCGKAQAGKKQYDRAIADFSEAIHLDPKSTEAYR